VKLKPRPLAYVPVAIAFPVMVALLVQRSWPIGLLAGSCVSVVLVATVAGERLELTRDEIVVLRSGVWRRAMPRGVVAKVVVSAYDVEFAAADDSRPKLRTRRVLWSEDELQSLLDDLGAPVEARTRRRRKPTSD
jgi:hypothetical protein